MKAPFATTRGYDTNKKIVGRKRHIAVDTDGRLLMVNLTAADISDSAGAQTILDKIRRRWPWLKHLFADGAYDHSKLMDKATFRDSSWRSCAGPTRNPASGCCPGAGSCSARSAG